CRCRLATFLGKRKTSHIITSEVFRLSVRVTFQRLLISPVIFLIVHGNKNFFAEQLFRGRDVKLPISALNNFLHFSSEFFGSFTSDRPKEVVEHERICALFFTRLRCPLQKQRDVRPKHTLSELAFRNTNLKVILRAP